MKAVLVAWLLALFSSVVMADSKEIDANSWDEDSQEISVVYNRWFIELDGGHKLYISATRLGLFFSMTIICDEGALAKQAKYVWKAGDQLGVSQSNCRKSSGLIDVAFHLREDFIDLLPDYPLILYYFTARHSPTSLAKSNQPN